MLIHNADITGSLTINGVPYNTGSFTGSFYGDGSQLSGVTSYTNADTLAFIQGYSGSYSGSFSGSFFGDGSNLSGVTSYTDADTLDFINSLNVVSGSIQTVSTVSDTFTSATSYTVTHNFGTKEVIVSVYENDILIFPSSITTPTTNTVTITFPEPVTGRVVVVKAGHIVSGSINYNSVLNKPTLVSGSSQISFTGITNKPTLVSGSSQIAAFGYATTGSNTFINDQTITGSLAINDSATNFLIEGNIFSQTYLTSNGAIVLNPGYGGVEVVGSYKELRLNDIYANGFVSGEIRANNGVVSGSSQVLGFNVFATTGSNQFKASQTITGSLTVTGAIVAQTLNVQQVTSSVVYSSGSNRFGNNTGNTHQFTGSVSVTGSLAVAGAGTFTGALNGSSAVLSSTLSANTTTITNGTRSWIISPSNASINHEFGGVVEGKIDPSSGGNSWFGATSGTTGAGAKHYFSSTGAATFASSVTANSTINGYLGTIAAGQNPATSGTTPVNPMLNLTNNRGVGMYFGGSYAGNYAQWIQVSDTGNLGVNYPLLLNPNGGNVGIGTASPSANLHVVRANDGGSGTPGVILRTDNGANDIVRFQDGTTIVAVVKNDGSIGIGTPTPTNKLHLTGASSTPSLRLGSTSVGFHWDIGRENQSTGDFVFNNTNTSTGTTEKMRITQDSVAYLRMASGTGGIQFNGDTAAANALDDYEEGTWTPTLPNGGTLTVLNARYVKIGQKVTVSFYIQLVSPTNNSSDFLIGGLPFANAGYSTFYTAGSFGYVDTANFSGWAPITGLNFGYIYFHAIDGTSSARKTNANYLTVAGGSNQIILTITYFAAT